MSLAEIQLSQRDGYWCGRFQAMASPCEVLLACPTQEQAARLVSLARDEALRIENKYSRYRDDNIIFRINHAAGGITPLDEETRQLLDYARQCFQLSDGLFDITSGVLRQAWHFDGSDHLPEPEQITPLRQRIGFQHLRLTPAGLQMPAGMEIDLGGVGKEYAVDRTAILLRQQGLQCGLVNFGGDIHVLGPRADGQPWRIAIEDPQRRGHGCGQIEVTRGALATSGDSHRYLLKDGVRYSHILDPRTGWPVPHPPRSVTVLAPTCLQAGMLATFGMLQGEQAEEFLALEGVGNRVIR